MPLIGINSVTSDPRKPSALEQIESGVNIAAKVLGTGLEAYKQLGPDGRVDRANKEAQTDYYKAQAEEKRATKNEPGKMSDFDKAYFSSFDKYQFTDSYDDSPGKIKVKAPDSGREMWMRPKKEVADKSTVSSMEDSVRKEIESKQLVTDFNTIHNQMADISTQFKDLDWQRDDPGRDINLLFSFMKVLDPGSRVTANEVELSSSASPLAFQIAQQWKRAVMMEKEGKVGILSPGLRKSFFEQMVGKYKVSRDRYDDIINQYKNISAVRELNPDMVIPTIRDIDISKFEQQLKDRDADAAAKKAPIIEKKKSFLERFGQ